MQDSMGRVDTFFDRAKILRDNRLPLATDDHEQLLEQSAL
jgi:hypothetical protein